MSSYTETPYPTFPRPDLHPARLLGLAVLHGLNPDNLNRTFSYLELGCGDGGNLIPLAEQYPSANFLGVDSSPTAIERGQAQIRQLSLKNITLRAEDLTQSSLNANDGTPSQYDLIVCHGVFSWVPLDVRERILSICRDNLCDTGVALISYNTLPGWRQRGVIRDVMGFGASLGTLETEGLSRDEVKLKGAAQFMARVSSARKGSDPYATYLREAIERLKHGDIGYLVHEYLEETNQPFLFTEFAKLLDEHQLQFVCESKPHLSNVEDLGLEVSGFIESLQSKIQQEQAIDFFRNRMFRESILCKKGATVSNQPSVKFAKNLVWSSEYRSVVQPREVSMREDSVFYEVASAREIFVPGGECARVLALLGERGPGGSSEDELIGDLRFAELLNGRSAQSVTECLFNLWKRGLIECFVHHIPASVSMPEKPKTSEFAKIHAIEGETVGSLLHRSIPLTESERTLLLLSDGSLNQKQLAVHPDIVARKVSPSQVNDSLKRLWDLGFFLA